MCAEALLHRQSNKHFAYKMKPSEQRAETNAAAKVPTIVSAAMEVSSAGWFSGDSAGELAGAGDSVGGAGGDLGIGDGASGFFFPPGAGVGATAVGPGARDGDGDWDDDGDGDLADGPGAGAVAFGNSSTGRRTLSTVRTQTGVSSRTVLAMRDVSMPVTSETSSPRDFTLRSYFPGPFDAMVAIGPVSIFSEAFGV